MRPRKILSRRIKNALAWAALIVVGPLAVSIIVVIGIIHGMNEGHSLSSALSPDGRYKAIVFERNTGATDAFHTEVAIVASHAGPPNIGGEFLSCDDNDGVAPSLPASGVPVEVQWSGTRCLVVRCSRSARTYAKSDVVTVKNGWFSHDTITITYVLLVTILLSANQRKAADLHANPPQKHQ